MWATAIGAWDSARPGPHPALAFAQGREIARHPPFASPIQTARLEHGVEGYDDERAKRPSQGEPARSFPPPASAECLQKGRDAPPLLRIKHWKPVL